MEQPVHIPGNDYLLKVTKISFAHKLNPASDNDCYLQLASHSNSTQFKSLLFPGLLFANIVGDPSCSGYKTGSTD